MTINDSMHDSSVHAYYSRNKEEDPQEFIPPLANKYTESDIEMLEKGIKKITLEDALGLL